MPKRNKSIYNQMVLFLSFLISDHSDPHVFHFEAEVTGSGFKQNFDDEDETQADEVNFTAENRHLISHVK
jgi:hypothetical protein